MPARPETWNRFTLLPDSRPASKPLKLITAVFHPARLRLIQGFLSRLGLRKLLITEVQVADRGTDSIEVYRGEGVAVPASRVKIEIAVDDDDTRVVIQTIVHGLRAGTRALMECNILVSEVEQAIRISTGETGIAAL